jgi:hypothetical protein
MAIAYDAYAFIMEYVPWDTKLGKELNILNEKHPAYNKLVKILNNQIFNHKKCLMAPVFRNLKPISIKKWLKYRIMDLIKSWRHYRAK